MLSKPEPLPPPPGTNYADRLFACFLDKRASVSGLGIHISLSVHSALFPIYVHCWLQEYMYSVSRLFS